MFDKPARRIERVFIHCTAYPRQDLVGDNLLVAVNDWHKKREFSADKNGHNIGYHFLIDCQGTLLKGRNIEENPVAQAGNNSRTIAMCLDGLYVEQFNAMQFETLHTLVKGIENAFGPGTLTWHGHCEVSAKACPVFDYRGELGIGHEHTAYSVPVNNRIEDFKSIEKQQVAMPYAPGSRIIRKAIRGQDVSWLQTVFGLKADGVFGQITYNQVVIFQMDHDLVPDGIVGSATWKALFEVFGRP